MTLIRLRPYMPWLLLFMITGVSLETLGDEKIEKAWSESGHADGSAGAFSHWDDEGKIPTNCAACHSSTGFMDYIGADGSSSMSVDQEHATGTVVSCDVCHNDSVTTLDKIRFPSGTEVDPMSQQTASCMVCHQGRASTVTVDAKLGDTEDDIVDPELGFINIHYKAAAATLLGSVVKGGYEYQGNTYSGIFAHAPQFDTCTGCHDPHNLEVRFESCTTCHAGASEPSAIRIDSKDYDGDSDVTEGIANEIQALHKSLGAAIMVYADQVNNAPILYTAARYPYFFNDSNGNRVADDAEIAYPNRYSSWTPRLLRAAYNYQYVAKDGGAYAHNPKYVLQLLYDSLKNMSEVIDIDLSNTHRP